MNLKEIEYVQQLERENERLKKRVEQLETMMYTETVDNVDYELYTRDYDRIDDCE